MAAARVLSFTFLFLSAASLAQQPRLMLPIGHTSSINSVRFSPDGKYILTSSADGTAKLWDIHTGALLVNFKSNIKSLNTALFSPDGKTILTVSSLEALELWDTYTGKLISQMGMDPIRYAATPDFGQRAAVFSQDGKKILAYGNGPIQLFDAGNGRLLSSFKLERNEVRSADLSPDGNKVVMTLGHGIVRISESRLGAVWDTNNDTLLYSLEDESIRYIFKTILFSPDGEKILSILFNYSAIIWDAQNGAILFELPGKVYSASFSKDAKRIITTGDDNTASIWDTQTGNLLLKLNGHTGFINSGVFNSGGDKILTSSRDSTIMVWDASTGVKLSGFKDPAGVVASPSFSDPGPNDPTGGKWAVSSSTDQTIHVWDPVKDAMIKNLKGYTRETNIAFYSPDGKKIITISEDSLTGIWNTKTGMLDSSKRYSIGNNPFLSDMHVRNEFMVVGVSDSLTVLWDINGQVGRYNGPGGAELYFHRSVSFSADRKRLVTSSTSPKDTSIKIWDAVSGVLLKELKETTHEIISAVFSPDGKKILTASSDNTQKIWDIEKGELQSTFFIVDSSNYFVQIPSGYYQSSPGATKRLHYVTNNLGVISFDQLDIKYNRPDKVMMAIGNTDTALIKSYRKAYEKRIRKLGIDTTAFRDGYTIPETVIVNRDAIEYDQKNERLSLHIKGVDSVFKLDRFNVWVNSVPVYGQRGVNIRNRNSKTYDITISIKLSQGENRIETSVINVNGTESYRMPLIVNYIPTERQKEMTRFIGIGIDRFADHKYDLRFSVKDIRDLARKLKEKYGDSLLVDTLFNEKLTVRNIKSLKKKLLQTGVNDKVIIAYSGHGILSKDFDYYLSTYSVNFTKPQQNGLLYDELEDLLDSIPARKKLMLIDACHSGEVDKDDLVTLTATSDSLIKGFKPVAYKKEGQLGLKNSFELMQSLFVNVGKSTGATIISAAAGTQFALERGDLKNGVFTYSILEAMNKYPTLKISELKKTVGERVEQLTKGLQKPTSRNETIAVDWSIW